MVGEIGVREGREGMPRGDEEGVLGRGRGEGRRARGRMYWWVREDGDEIGSDNAEEGVWGDPGRSKSSGGWGWG